VIAVAAFGSVPALGQSSGTASSPQQSPAQISHQLVAEVDGREITLADVRRFIASLPEPSRRLPLEVIFPRVREALVQQEALVVRADQEGLAQNPDVRRASRRAAERVLVNEYLDRKLTACVQESDLFKRYESDPTSRAGVDEVHLGVIATATSQAAAMIIDQLHHGTHFDALARQFSQDLSAGADGDLGYVRRENLTPEVGAVAFVLPPGRYSQYPVFSAGMWFVVQVKDRRHRTLTYAEAEASLRQAAMREQAPIIAAAALNGLRVHLYDLSGDETTSSYESSNLSAKQGG
jgi:parvulin-like peptidyl-prolyl isomerase